MRMCVRALGERSMRRPARAVTVNGGMTMPAWFDCFGLSEGDQEDVDGIRAATQQSQHFLLIRSKMFSSLAARR